MERVIGLGGIFIKSKDPVALREWYHTHLGIASEEWGAVFSFTQDEADGKLGNNIWAPFKEDTKYFLPSAKDFMINFRVRNCEKLVDVLRGEGVEIIGELEKSEFGIFAWVLDPDGNKVELWEPPAHS